ncbi:MAG TPA: FAD-dependent oxidoreductase, partial [Polyangiaceae bacterium]|nr:FAD-dependent oxidoreductase [Polyangiaceae bacterium]
TPDANPIVGPVDALNGFFQISGFMGHGFMMAPILGQLVARQIATGVTDAAIADWNLARFERGQLLDEGMIIG